MVSDPTTPFWPPPLVESDQSHRICVWYIYLHLVDIYGFHVGKYTSPPTCTEKVFSSDISNVPTGQTKKPGEHGEGVQAHVFIVFRKIIKITTRSVIDMFELPLICGWECKTSISLLTLDLSFDIDPASKRKYHLRNFLDPTLRHYHAGYERLLIGRWVFKGSPYRTWCRIISNKLKYMNPCRSISFHD